MNDSRLKVAASLLDDARELLVNIVDEGRRDDANLRDYTNIDAARQFINSALPYIQAADSSGGDAA